MYQRLSPDAMMLDRDSELCERFPDAFEYPRGEQWWRRKGGRGRERKRGTGREIKWKRNKSQGGRRSGGVGREG